MKALEIFDFLTSNPFLSNIDKLRKLESIGIKTVSIDQHELRKSFSDNNDRFADTTKITNAVYIN